MAGYSLRIARNLHEFATGDYRGDAMRKAAVAVADTVGVAIPGAREPVSVAARAAVLTHAGKGVARIWGTDLAANPLDAALLNGTAAHALDFDDTSTHMMGHHSVLILPGLFALAADRGAGGAAVLHAYVCGYETGARFGLAIGQRQYELGWHPTATLGIFAAVAANAVLLGLDPERTANALGIAVSMASGVKSNFGSMSKPLGAGHAARNAMLAVLLAEAGMTSSPVALEGRQGFFNVFCGAGVEQDLSPLLEPWSRQPLLLDRERGVIQKRYPCCFGCASPVDAALELRGRAGDRIAGAAAVDIAITPARRPHIDRPAPSTGLEGKFSVQYCVATALATGNVARPDFDDPARLTDPARTYFLERMTLSEEPFESEHGARVGIVFADGTRIEHELAEPMGSTAANALTEEMIALKFRACTQDVLGEAGADELYRQLLGLETLSDLSALPVGPAIQGD